MNHKLQDSSFTNDGSKTVGRNTNSNSTSEISRNGAGSREARTADSVSEAAFGQDSQFVGDARSEGHCDVVVGSQTIPETSIQREISTEQLPASVAQPPSAVSPTGIDVPCEPKGSGGFGETPGTEHPIPHQQEHESSRGAAAVPQVSFGDLRRCEVARSAGYDPTGEHAFACGALAQVLCECCGPMCSSCADETFCFQGEHKLTSLPDDGPLPPSHKTKPPTSEVVYVEIKCPNCQRVRLALPKKHTPKAIRKCPICKAKGPAEYLAHGFTRRRLPYHEIFTEEKELPEGIEFKRRTPWDPRPNWWVEE